MSCTQFILLDTIVFFQSFRSLKCKMSSSNLVPFLDDERLSTKHRKIDSKKYNSIKLDLELKHLHTLPFPDKIWQLTNLRNLSLTFTSRNQILVLIESG